MSLEQISEQLQELRLENFKSKPIVQLSTATYKDCTRNDGLNLDLKYVRGKKKSVPTLHLPQEILESDFELPDLLCNHLEMLEDVWSFNKEPMCRSKIDAILANALYVHWNKLCVFGEIDNSWEAEGVIYSGYVDYLIGSGQQEDGSLIEIDSCILAVEAKLEWPQNALPQVLAEAGCLLMNRRKAGKDTPIFAVLTNSKFFQFFAIDTNGVVYSSGPEIVVTRGISWKSNKSLQLVWKWLHWFLKSMPLISPRCSVVDLSEEDVKANVRNMAQYFGPR